MGNNGKKSAMRKAKAKLRLCNLFIAALCVAAVVFLYMQTFWNVQVVYNVSAQQLQGVLREHMNVELSEESLEEIDLKISVNLTLEGRNLTNLLTDEIAAVANRNAPAPEEETEKETSDTGKNEILDKLLQVGKEDGSVREIIHGTVEDLLEQTKKLVPAVVAVYVKTTVNERLNDSAEAQTLFRASVGGNSVFDAASPRDIPDIGEIAANVDVRELAEEIEKLLEEGSVTVDEATETAIKYLQKNQEEFGLTDEDIAAVEEDVSSVLTNLADENDVIDTDKLVAGILGQMGLELDQSRLDEGAELSELLTDYIVNLTQDAEDGLYILFMVLSLVMGILYLLWGLLFVKSVIKTFTGKPMGAFFVKLLTGLPYLVLILVPSVVLNFGGAEAVATMLEGLIGAEAAGLLGGMSVAFGGGFAAALCTLILFLFGFLYSACKRKYKQAKRM